MRSFDFDHVELAVLLGALARSEKELELFPGEVLKSYKQEIHSLILKLEGHPQRAHPQKKVDS